MPGKNNIYYLIIEPNNGNQLESSSIDSIVREQRKLLDDSYISEGCSFNGRGSNDAIRFGTFGEVLKKEGSFMLEFFPYSIQSGVRTRYQFNNSSLNAAINFLDKRGYSAKVYPNKNRY